MMMKTNPWETLSPAVDTNDLNICFAHRQKSLDFMWAKDSFGNLLFLLHTDSKNIINLKIPNLNGIKIDLGHFHKKKQLTLALTNQDDTDIFYTLCKDLINCAKNIRDESIAIRFIFLRLEKWQYFLKNSKKTADKNFLKGLLGELYFLKNNLLTKYDPQQALSCWKAPSQSVHDFEINNNTVEVKTRSSVNSVTISSYEQMHTQLGNLFLFVLTLAECSREQKNALNIFDIIFEIKKMLNSQNPLLLDTFETLLLNYGFLDLGEYNDIYFQIIKSEIYKIEDGFPRIESIPNGIEKISYRINLNSCQNFLTDVIF